MNELSDKNRPRKLEDIFREGMEEAEMAPSDLLWSRIERDLHIKEAGLYKKRLVWYQRLAAACVVLVLFAGAYLFFDARQVSQPGLIARKETPAEPALAADTPKTMASASKPTSTAPVGHGMKRGKASENENHAAWHSPKQIASAARAAGPEITRSNPRKFKDPNYRSPSADQVAVIPSDNPSVLALTSPGNTMRLEAGGSAGTEIQSIPTLMGESYQPAGPGQSLARFAKSRLRPDSLAQAFTWPGLSTGVALQDTLLVLAQAPVPALPAEPTAKEDKPGSRWRFGGKYASQYFDQNIALNYKQPAPGSPGMVPSMVPFANAGAASYADALKEFDQETGSGFSFNTGVSAAYQLNKHIDLETGLGYTQNVAITNTSYIFNNAQIGSRHLFEFNSGADVLKNYPGATGIPSTAFLATLTGGSTLNQTAVTRTQSFDTQYRYRLLGIPVKMNYQTRRSKSFYYASLGMLTNLLVQANILSDSDRVPDLKYTPDAEGSPFRKWHFAAVASAGKGFEIAQGLQIKAGIEATQYLTHLTIHPANLGGKQHKPYTLGLALSSSYTFGK